MTTQVPFLHGIKAIEFAGLAPVPFCGLLLADFGANVTIVNNVNRAAKFAFASILFVCRKLEILWHRSISDSAAAKPKSGLTLKIQMIKRAYGSCVSQQMFCSTHTGLEHSSTWVWTQTNCWRYWTWETRTSFIISHNIADKSETNCC